MVILPPVSPAPARIAYMAPDQGRPLKHKKGTRRWEQEADRNTKDEAGEEAALVLPLAEAKKKDDEYSVSWKKWQ